MRRLAAVLVLFVVFVIGACGSSSGTGGDGGPAGGGDGGLGPDAGDLPFLVTAPQQSSEFVRGYLDAAGNWVAKVDFAAQGSHVASVNWMDGDNLIGIGLPPTFAFSWRYPMDGDFSVTAVALDDNETPMGMTTVSFTVTPTPTVTNCAGALDLLGVQYDSGPTTPGITSPITITMPLNGLLFIPAGQTLPRATWTMDCNTAVSLWRLVDLLQFYAVTSVTDGGIYDTRPFHSAGLGLDILGFATADGMTYSIGHDWTPDVLTGGDTPCTAFPSMTPKNELLHSFLCEVASDGIFNNQILAPAAGDAHADHFHFDLVPGATGTAAVAEGLAGD